MKVFRSPGVYVKNFTMYPRCTSCMKFLSDDVFCFEHGDVCCSRSKIEYLSEMEYIRVQRELKIKEIEDENSPN